MLLLVLPLLVALGVVYAQTPSACDGYADLNTNVVGSGQNFRIPPGYSTRDYVQISNGGVLCAGNYDFHFNTVQIAVLDGGTFAVGTDGESYASNGTLEFYRDPSINPPIGAADQGMVVRNGGIVSMVSLTRDSSWVRLSASAVKGDTSISITTDVFGSAGTFGAPNSNWVGQEIVLFSTDYNPTYTDRVIVTSVSGGTISFTPALNYDHFAGFYEERGEVGLLTRNLRILGRPSASPGGNPPRRGAHLMFENETPEDIDPANPPSVYINGVELTRCGQAGELGRYPLHLHRLGYGGSSANLRFNSLHDNFQRAIVIHSTHDAIVQYNVVYETFGHAIFLEDAVETGNVVEFNLVALARVARYPERLIPSDNEATSYWITNLDNHINYNVAAGSLYLRGFWMAIPDGSQGPSRELYPNVYPVSTSVLSFDGNQAHSNYDGFFLDLAPAAVADPALQFIVTQNYHPTNNATPRGAAVFTIFNNLLGWKNMNRGIWSRGSGIHIDGCKFFDNGIGVTHASNTLGSITSNTEFRGFTDNRGTPDTWNQLEIPFGRSLPFDYASGYLFPVRGFEYYDGRRRLINGTCSLYPNDPDLPGQACISVLRDNRFSMTSNSLLDGLTILDGSTAVHFPDFLGDGARSVAFWDVQGDITGVPMGSVTIENPFLMTEGCTVNEDHKYIACDDRQFVTWSINNMAYSDECAKSADACTSATTRIQQGNALVAPYLGFKPGVYLRNFGEFGSDSVFEGQKLIGPPADANACCPDLSGSDADLTAPSSGYSTSVPRSTEIGMYWSFATPSRFFVWETVNVDVNDTNLLRACIPCGVSNLIVGRAPCQPTDTWCHRQKTSLSEVKSRPQEYLYHYEENGDPGKGCYVSAVVGGGGYVDGLYVKYDYPESYGPTSAGAHCGMFSDLQGYYNSQLSSAAEMPIVF